MHNTNSLFFFSFFPFYLLSKIKFIMLDVSYIMQDLQEIEFKRSKNS